MGYLGKFLTRSKVLFGKLTLNKLSMRFMYFISAFEKRGGKKKKKVQSSNSWKLKCDTKAKQPL